MGLSSVALDISYAVRLHEGADVQGVGPDIATLVTLEEVRDKVGSEIRAALRELELLGLLRIDYCIGVPRPGVPNELRDVAGVAILEPMQQMFDEMGW